MRKFLAGFIIGSFIFCGIAYGLRISKPTQFTLPWDDNKITELNNVLDNLWTLTNGKYNFDVKTSVPTWTGKEGDAVVYSSGGTYRIYIYLADAWRVWTSD